jgi:hypothetical protein
MPRGRVLRTKVKEAKAIEEAKLKGQYKAERNKPLEVSLKEHLGKMIDRIDPLEIGAISGMTILVHHTILTNPALLERLNVLIGAAGKVATEPWNVWLTGIMDYLGLGAFAPLSMEQPPLIVPKEVTDTLSQNQIISWLVSFAIAFVIVRYCGQILQSLGNATSSLTVLVGLLLPATVAAA